MQHSTRWKLRHWILLGYAVPVIALVLSAAGAVIGVQRVKSEAENLAISQAVNDRINVMDVNLQILSRTTRSYLLEKDPIALETFQSATEGYIQTIEELRSLIRSEEQLENLNLLEEKIAQFQQTEQELIDLVNANRAEDAISQWRAYNGRSQVEDITLLTEQMKELEQQIIEEDTQRQEEALNQLQFLVIASAIVSGLLSIGMGYWIVSRTAHRMNEAAMLIASSSSEIAASIEQQERTTAQQATSVNETTTTMEEMGASSRQSAEQAEVSAMGAQQALSLAERGNSAVNRTLQGMDTLRAKVNAISDQILRLSEQTSQIGNISGLVSDLANQTNMLALNAAVEAVRAGEHGKGFAVVSSEIRKLADQSRKSAEKINGLVSDIQTAINSTVMVTDEGTKTVEEGVQIAEETANVFIGVSDAVNNVVLSSQQISLNVQQQATAVEQVVSAMSSLNQAARETASGISQVKIGTQRLNEAANDLKVMV